MSCPTCGATGDEPCRTKTGNAAKSWHKDRDETLTIEGDPMVAGVDGYIEVLPSMDDIVAGLIPQEPPLTMAHPFFVALAKAGTRQIHTTLPSTHPAWLAARAAAAEFLGADHDELVARTREALHWLTSGRPVLHDGHVTNRESRRWHESKHGRKARRRDLERRLADRADQINEAEMSYARARRAARWARHRLIKMGVPVEGP